MGISIARLPGDIVTRKWLDVIFDEPTCREALPDGTGDKAWRDELCVRIAANEVYALIPAVDGIGAGLFFGAPGDGFYCTGHQFVLPPFRGWPAFKMAKMCSDKALADMPEITHLIGIIEESNKASVWCAKKAGFVATGTLPRYFKRNGKSSDCIIMVKER